MIHRSRRTVLCRRKLHVEELEQRYLMSADLGEAIEPYYVAAFDPNHIITPLDQFTGVVRLEVQVGGSAFGGTGALLHSRRHILTAAHLFPSGFGATQVLFQNSTTSELRSVPASRVFIHPNFNGNVGQGFDIAIVELASDAPGFAQSYTLQRTGNEIGIAGEKVGYGQTGTGTSGSTPGTFGTRRDGLNRYDALAPQELFAGPPDTALAYDFDSGSPANDAFGFFFGLPHLGYGADEVSAAPGDSGGPTFLAPATVSGITSYGVGQVATDVSPGVTNSSFGEFAVDTRVSSFAGWVDSLTTKSIVTGADAGGGPHVRVFDVNPLPSPTLTERFGFFPYDPGFTGGVRVATGDVNGDGTPDIVTAPGPTGGPHIRVFDGRNGQLLPGTIGNFFAYPSHVTTGLYVAAGDVNGDGRADIMVAPGPGGGPHVKVFSGLDGSLIFQYFAYNPGFTGGVQVALGDINRDGHADLITGAGPGGGPHVRVLSGAPGHAELASFFPYDINFMGGVNVASGDVDGDGRLDIITGPASSGGSHVRVFSGLNQSILAQFFAFNPGYSGATRVAATTVTLDGRADIVVSTGPGSPSLVQMFNAQNSALVGQFSPYGGFTGGVFVAGGLPQRLFVGLPQSGGGGFGGGGFVLALGAVFDQPIALEDSTEVQFSSIDGHELVAIVPSESTVNTSAVWTNAQSTEAMEWDDESNRSGDHESLDQLIEEIASHLALNLRDIALLHG